MSHLELIYDEAEVKRFFDTVLPPLSDLEVYFVSLSARNKYLSEEEQEALHLGRTEMFERRIIRERNWDKFLRTLYKFESNEKAYTTKNNSIIPSKCITCYININPSNVLKAYAEYNKTMTEYIYEIANNSIKNNNTENIIYRITKSDRLLLDQLQKCRGTKHLIDVDFDVPDDQFVKMFTKELKSKNVSYEVIDTKSGYHVLMRKDTVKFNFPSLLECYNKQAAIAYKEKTEIVVNKNEMVPLPGTSQGGHPVRIITKGYL